MPTAADYRTAATSLDRTAEAAGARATALERSLPIGYLSSCPVRDVVDGAKRISARNLLDSEAEFRALAKVCRQRAKVCDAYDEAWDQWVEQFEAWSHNPLGLPPMRPFPPFPWVERTT